jgi:hypothetical protein
VAPEPKQLPSLSTFVLQLRKLSSVGLSDIELFVLLPCQFHRMKADGVLVEI